MQRRIAFALGLALWAGAPSAHATAFFTGLGFLPGATISSAVAVSADGSTVVGASGDEAFRWMAASRMAALPAGRATDVSADGSVIVGPGFRWSAEDGVMSTGLGGDTAVSSDGAVVVGTRSGEAYWWTESEGPVPLPLDDPPGIDFESHATDVSADGSVIVGYRYDGDENWGSFRWTAAGGRVGARGSIAGAVSSDGSIVVGQRKNFDNFGGYWPREAYLWRTGQVDGVGLGFVQPPPDPLEGGDDRRESFARGASDEGLVVGRSCGEPDLPNIPNCEAFLWDEGNGMRALREVLESEYGLDLTGWTLTDANDITPDGRTIVGTGTNPDGPTEAWIAFVPEPGTVELLALGLAALAARARRQGRKVVASWRSSQ